MSEEQADALVHSVVRDWRRASLAELDHALCVYAARLTNEQGASTPEHLEELRALGLNDRGIHDLTQVIGYFNYITRIADGLGVEPEDFLSEWGGASGEPSA